MDDLRPTESDSPLNRKVRAFLAIGPPPTEWIDALKAWVQPIRLQWEENRIWKKPPISWAKWDNLHLTLRFFGYIPQTVVLAITQRIENLASAAEPFEMESVDWVFFPNASNPRILGVKLRDQTGNLFELGESIGQKRCCFGQEPTRRAFVPHVTLARLGLTFDERVQFFKLWKQKPFPDLPPWPVRKLTLFESKLQPSGAIYTPTAQFPLGNSPDPSKTIEA